MQGVNTADVQCLQLAGKCRFFAMPCVCRRRPQAGKGIVADMRGHGGMTRHPGTDFRSRVCRPASCEETGLGVVNAFCPLCGARVGTRGKVCGGLRESGVQGFEGVAKTEGGEVRQMRGQSGGKSGEFCRPAAIQGGIIQRVNEQVGLLQPHTEALPRGRAQRVVLLFRRGGRCCFRCGGFAVENVIHILPECRYGAVIVITVIVVITIIITACIKIGKGSSAKQRALRIAGERRRGGVGEVHTAVAAGVARVVKMRAIEVALRVDIKGKQAAFRQTKRLRRAGRQFAEVELRQQRQRLPGGIARVIALFWPIADAADARGGRRQIVRRMQAVR